MKAKDRLFFNEEQTKKGYTSPLACFYDGVDVMSASYDGDNVESANEAGWDGWFNGGGNS